MGTSTHGPSPGTIIAALALTFAIAGTAIAAPGATTSAVKKSTVKKIAKKQINKLAPGLSVANAATVDTLVPFGPVQVAEGAADVTLASNGPLSIVGSCDADGADTEANVLVATTEENSAFGGDDEKNGVFGPATPESGRRIEDPGASSTTTPDHSDGYDDQFGIIAPSGAAMHGTVGSTADGTANTCRFYGSVTIVG